MLQHAMARAPSVPGRTCRHISAREPSHVTRGSMTASLVPRFIMSTIAWPNRPSGLEAKGSLPHTTTSSGRVKAGSS